MKVLGISKRIISLILAMTMILSVLNGISFDVFATETELVTSTDFTYEILNGSYCTISGYIGTDTEIVIPSEMDGYIVQQISSNAFKNNTTIEKVVFPETVETVGSNVFSGCTSLEYIGFNNKLTNIGSYMFSRCTALSEIIIPIGVTKIGRSAFEYCTGLTKVELPETLLTIDRYAFDGCTGITSIDIPDSVTAIGGYAFNGCSNLTSVKLPLGWTTLTVNSTSSSTSPFYNCKNLTEITVPEEMTSIPSYAFASCSNLKKITLSESLTKINSYAFSGCSGLTEIVIPENVTTIGASAFSGCTGLKEITIPSKVTQISRETFAYCTGLTKVELPDTLLTIDRYAFDGCTGITSIDIPDSVTAIGGYAFNGCSNLTSVKLPLGWTTLTVNSTSSSTSPFYNCKNLTEITVPEGMTSIPSYAFAGCTSLNNITLLEGLITIGSHAFDNCTRINYLTLPESLELVGDYAFYNCIGLRSISMGAKLNSVGKYAFYGCDGLIRLYLGDNIETLSDYAFADCINLKTVILPINLKSIGKGAFANCPKISNIIIPDSVTNIAENAFYGISNLTFYCSMNSFAATYAIDHNIPIVDIEENNYTESLYIDRQNSYYKVNGDGISASGYLAMVAKYSFKSNVTASKIKLIFNIPTSVELEESSLTVDNVLCTNYTFEDGTLTIPVTNVRGVVRFLLRPLDYDLVTAYSKVSFYDGSAYQTEVLGTIYTEIPILSITSQNQTSDSFVGVSGVTMPNSSVTLYLNGTKYSTVKANKAGDYSATVRFSSPSNGKKYRIRAEVIDSTGTIVTAETITVYKIGTPILTEVIMEYGGKKYNLNELLGTKPNITWASGYKYKFTVKFKNADSVSGVYIVSTRNNVKKYMQATWDDSKQSFIAEGYFDNNSSYVPGFISVEYIRNDGGISFEDGFDFTSDEVHNELPEEWRDAEVIINENTTEKIDMIVDYPDNTSDGKDYALHYVTENKIKSKGYTEQTAISEGYAKITDANGKSMYVRQSMESNKITISTIDFTQTVDGVVKVTDMVIDLYQGYAGETGGKIFKAVDKLGDAIDLLGWLETSAGTISDIAKIDRIQRDIRNSNLSPEEKERALSLTYQTQVVNIASFLMKGALFAAGTLALTGPWGIVVASALIITGEIVDMWDEYFMERLLGMSFTWAIDPSGFIYDNETQEPIVGATVTAYWIPYDENNESYWEEKPDNDNYGEEWDASLFSQDNPLTTDISGWYAWDVPEGWWRVKVECSGYEEVWSEWLPVPPPQTAVNLGMKKLPSETEKVLGDVNGDNAVSIMDATAIQLHIAQLEIIPEDKLACADVDGDGKVTIRDATRIQLFIAQLIPEF